MLYDLISNRSFQSYIYGTYIKLIPLNVYFGMVSNNKPEKHIWVRCFLSCIRHLNTRNIAHCSFIVHVAKFC